MNLKFILLCNILFILMPAHIYAQRSNIAHINTNALWELMPEKKKADSILTQMNKIYTEHFNKVNDEINLLIAKYQSNPDENPAIKTDMLVEIESKQQRQEKFKQEAENDLVKKRDELFAPIRKKMQAAIDSVAKKYKYVYVLDSSFGTIIYSQNSADDILELVKKELNLK